MQDYCQMPDCRRLAARLFEIPICSHHARRIYLTVRDRIEAVTAHERTSVPVPPSHPRPPHRVRLGLVYFMQCGDFIKIGFTTNLESRRQSLGGRVLATVPGTMKDEKAMQMRFGSAWSHREYFHPEPELVAFIDSLA